MKFFSKHLYRVILIVSCSLPLTAQAALPDFTEIVDRSKDSVVNISTKAKVDRSASKRHNIPELPEGSPFGELFDKFFEQDEFERRRRDS
ncbi:MAG: serine peptidase, partial [Gammaproteobacteria bacterium]|nr:serine peptidase [Gammaproteobacteria bacterium]